MKKRHLLITLLLILAACTSEASEESKTMNTAQPESNQEHAVMVHVQNWEFAPNTITFKQGEKASLHMMVIEGDHGIAIPELGIREELPEGSSLVIPIPTDTLGTYPFLCNVHCGAGHRNMTGVIMIEK